MFALMELRWDNVYRWSDDVVDGQYVLLGRQWTKNDCKITEGKRGVHFSHEAMDKGDLSHLSEIENTANYRPLVVEHWMHEWEWTCERRP